MDPAKPVSPPAALAVLTVGPQQLQAGLVLMTATDRNVGARTQDRARLCGDVGRPSLREGEGV